MGSEFAELQKRHEKQQDPYAHRYAPKPQTKLAKPGKPPIRLAATYPEQRRVIDPENPGQYKIEGWTPEAQARYDDNPELAWLKDPNGRPPTPQEAVLMRKAKKRQQQSLAATQSARVQGQEAVPQTPVEQFQHRLKDGAIHRLEQNKARLTQVQGTYQNTQTSNEQWKTLRTLANRDQQLKRLQDQTNQELMTLVAKKEFSNTPLGRLANQTPLEEKLGLPDSDPIQNDLLLNVMGINLLNVDSKYRGQFDGLRGRLELLHHVRQEMRAVHPALAMVNTAEVAGTANTPEQNAKIYGQMSAGFDGMRSDMSKLSQTIEHDPSRALLFDALKQETLKTFKNPAERQQAEGWVKQQEDKDATLKAIGATGAIGLTVSGALGGPLGWGANVVRGLLLGGSVLGTATAAYEFPQLQVMDLAAKAGAAGGEKLTSQTPEAARMNLAMGYANLALAGLDLGLTPGLIGKVAKIPGAVKSAANLTRKQSQVLVNSVAQHAGTLSDAALEKLLQGVRTADANTTVIIVNGDGTLTRLSPLEGVTQKLETTTAARASGKAKKASGQKKPKDMTPVERLAHAKKNYGHASNWDEIKPLIGTAVNKNTKLPPGYVFYEKPVKRGARPLFIIRENANDASFAPLMLEGGKIQVGKARLSRGLDAMKANLKAVGINTPKGYQLNHLVPDTVTQSDPLMFEMLQRNLYDVDRASNLLPMPGEVRAAHPDLIGHYGSHGDYSDLVQRQLRQEARNLTRKYGSLDKVPDNKLEGAVRDIEDNMREGIVNRSQNIPTRYDSGTGTRVLSEGISDPDFVA